MAAAAAVGWLVGKILCSRWEKRAPVKNYLPVWLAPTQLLWVRGEHASMKSAAPHNARCATARNNLPADCPNAASAQRLTRVDPARQTSACVRWWLFPHRKPATLRKRLSARFGISFASCLLGTLAHRKTLWTPSFLSAWAPPPGMWWACIRVRRALPGGSLSPR